MDELLITTVVPTYRRPAMLSHALGSALGQTWPHLLVRVFDNASGDETEETVARIAEADNRVRYHRHPVNIGAYENFNFGVRAVETPFFSVLSDDDVLMSGFYEQAMGAFKEHPDAMFVAMHTLEVDDSGRVMGGSGVRVHAGKRYYPAGEAYYGMWDGTVPAIWTGFLFRREVIEEIGFVNIFAGPAADVAFVRHVLARYPGVVLPSLAALLRVHPESFSIRMSPQVKINRSFWRAQAEDIENDGRVSAPIRSTVRYAIEQMYVRGIRLSVFSSLIDGRVDAAMEAIKYLRNLGYPLAAILLRLVVLCHENLPFASHALGKAALRRRARHKKLLMDINLQYESQRDQFKNLLHSSVASVDLGFHH